ncbi:MAG: YihY/virulence factor BrkB family protein [Bacteroidia bacterium]|nr:YihY/virulence factor BrkB family protein [Bacteroidia bacterium]
MEYLKHKQSVVDFFKLLKMTGIEAVSDNIFKLAAALAYYTVFSLVPMLIIIVWITGIFYDPTMVQGELLIKLNELIGPQAVTQIHEVMLHSKFDQTSGWAKALGIFTLILSATGIFVEIQDSINLIWGLKVKPARGFLKLILNRLLSFSLLISLGFVLTVFLLINVLIAALTYRIEYYFPYVPVGLFYILNQGFIFIIIAFLFSCIFKVLPDAKVRWKDVYPGASLSTFLFMLGKYIIGYYLGKNATISAYGSAGSVIIILMWVYFSSIILYFGAVFTESLLKMRNIHIQPTRYAEWVDARQITVESNTEVHKENIPQ